MVSGRRLLCLHSWLHANFLDVAARSLALLATVLVCFVNRPLGLGSLLYDRWLQLGHILVGVCVGSLGALCTCSKS